MSYSVSSPEAIGDRLDQPGKLGRDLAQLTPLQCEPLLVTCREAVYLLVEGGDELFDMLGLHQPGLEAVEDEELQGRPLEAPIVGAISLAPRP